MTPNNRFVSGKSKNGVVKLAYDRSCIKWGHAINSKIQLNKTLYGTNKRLAEDGLVDIFIINAGKGNYMMIEVNVSMGTYHC